MKAMRTIGVVTVGRSDYGIYRPILEKMAGDAGLQPHLLVAGMHWLEAYGYTAGVIEKDGFKKLEKIVFSFDSDSPSGIAATMGEAVSAFSKSYAKKRPDILLVLGDRFEMHAAVLAALPFKIPVAHIHGGELTLGAIDNVLRHSITLFSHLHFAATEEYKKRILQMGEEPWRVFCSGAPALDGIAKHTPLSLQELARHLDISLEEAPILVTYHPATLEFENTAYQVDQLFLALARVDRPIIFTASNTDTGNAVIREKMGSFIASRKKTFYVSNFGPDLYFSILANAAAMVGNSSSGLIEAPSFELPVVNIGRRQEGRMRARNVIDTGYSAEEITKGLSKALSPEFRASLKGVRNPCGDGRASEKIVHVLREISLDEKLIIKRFVDIHGI
ncbi:MAG: UDP-N-acetylglucosamine 2-epimerase [Deltaproteobacteria bacterium]|nr:UDP-N-acetylglucosamine 2-epimerase [Deltaproteobacteria bacterium]